MPPKRKAATAAKGASKAGKSSALSTPGPGTPRSLEGSDQVSTPADEDFDPDTLPEDQKKRDEELGKAADEFVQDWDLSSRRFHKTVGTKHVDSATRYFGMGKRDYSYLALKPDHHNRPLWIDPDKGVIVLERFHPLAEAAADFLVTIAEPKSRPTFLHEYSITTHSLYAAVSVGLNRQDIINSLERFLKTPLPEGIRLFIESCTDSYGKVKLVLKDNKYFVESVDAALLQKLLKDEVIGPLRIQTGSDELTKSHAPTMAGLVIQGTKDAAGAQQAAALQQGEKAPAAQTENTAEADVYAVLNQDDDDDDEQDVVHAFQIPDSAVEIVQKRCLELSYPILEEYDFRNDKANATLDIDLRPNTQIRPYQEKSLSKMFGNGRAKSGIIVLPCGAGKTLVGVTAACTIKKGVVVLCTSSMSVYQWRNEFLKWSNIDPKDIAVFTSDNKKQFERSTGIIVTTYSMVTNNRERAHDSKKMMDFLQGREWGLMLLDEVHVAPADVFRRVISSIKSHAKLGLTATLLREDDKISHLNFLIGPKLYEANWMELSQQGHIAKVQCAEVWCPMTPEFYDEYLRSNARARRTLYAMNPNKFQACQYLIRYHEARGDKIIVFSDEVWPLIQYASTLNCLAIHGGTAQAGRQFILDQFQHNPTYNTLFLSKIGDTSLDLPEATVLIQISSHFGSRRQEAQRLGRILRAKRRNDEGFNAFFYSLVSKDTQEMYYSAKRQAFLVDQGYAFKVITHLANIENTPNLVFPTAQARRELLQQTLLQIEKGLPDDDKTDDLFGKTGSRKKGGVRRVAGTLGELSGGQDMAYMEQSSKAIKQKRKTERNPFFNKLSREKEKARIAARNAQ